MTERLKGLAKNLPIFFPVSSMRRQKIILEDQKMIITLGNGKFVAEVKNNRIYILQKYFKRAKKDIQWLTGLNYFIIIS